jgi:hypothetical protein
MFLGDVVVTESLKRILECNLLRIITLVSLECSKLDSRIECVVGVVCGDLL